MAAARHRVKISATVDPELLSEVDAYVGEHPGADRSGVIDEALALWLARRQDHAMEEQFDGPGAPADERRHWQFVQREAIRRALRRDG